MKKKKKGQTSKAACCKLNMSTGNQSSPHIYSAFDNPAGLMNILCDLISVSQVSSYQAWDLTSSRLIFFPSSVHLIFSFPSYFPPHIFSPSSLSIFSMFFLKSSVQCL